MAESLKSIRDTSYMYEKLLKQFHSQQHAIDVDFRQLVSWLRAGDQLTHHIHPYPAKLLPHIAHFFLRAYSFHSGDGVVLDPFCGSGTVALEASLAGRVPNVADANPLALLLSKVKTTPYDTKKLRVTANLILNKALKLKIAPAIEIVNEHFWYLPEHKKTLEVILKIVNDIEDKDQRDFFRVCFSNTARRVSFADPAISVPVRLKVKENFKQSTNDRILSRLKWIQDTSPLVEFEQVMEANIRRVEETNLLYPHRLAAKQVGTDARELQEIGDCIEPLKSNSIPLVITSPPYGSAQKYIRSSSIALNWLGLASPKELSALEAKSIGREHLPRFREKNSIASLPSKYEQLIERIASKNELRARITKRYLAEMSEVSKEVSRVTSKDGKVIFVLGNNQVCGETLRNDEYMIECFQENGLHLELGLIDDIKSRGLMTKRNRTASMISRETVLVFRKYK